jgi:hypothetical protein
MIPSNGNGSPLFGFGQPLKTYLCSCAGINMHFGARNVTQDFDFFEAEATGDSLLKSLPLFRQLITEIHGKCASA